MNLSEFRRVGHWPTLLCSFLYFDISFMVWILLGALANCIAVELGLSDAEKGFLVALPLLGGAGLRIVLGLMTDRVGARPTAACGMLVTVIPLLMGWLWADSYSELLLVGMLLGVAGASFAVALPLASRWYPPQYQGLAMGIAGAGNSGTALATFFAPRLAEHVGWRGVFGLSLIPVLATLVLFVLFARESPERAPAKRWSDYARVLGLQDTWIFCFFYAVTFGGFVGLASFLGIFFYVEYGLDRVHAGTLTTLCVIAGSFLRPVGGYLADRMGGVRVLAILYGAIGLLLLDLATMPPLAWTIVLIVAIMGLLGMGNGSVFQLVPQRFPREIGVVTGIVGAAGGIGGFFLPNMLALGKQYAGSFGPGFLLFAVVAFGSAVTLINVAGSWEGLLVGKSPLPPQEEAAA